MVGELSQVMLVLAQNGDAPAGGGGGAQDGGSPIGLFLPLVLIVVLFYFMMIRPQRRQEQQRKAMLGALKKNDHVVTIGGIHGVVTSIKPDDDEVVIRVDESSNTKLRVTRSSIARIVTPNSQESSKGQ